MLPTIEPPLHPQFVSPRALPPQSFGVPLPAPTRTVTDLIASQVASLPHAVAARHGTNEMTYAQLDAAADLIAAHLRELGIGTGDVVGVFVQRSLAMVAAILGVLKVGAAYAPQDARISPPAHLTHVVQATEMRALLTTAEFAQGVPDIEHCIIIDQLLGTAPHTSTTDGPVTTGTATAADPCAVIFTSGTTGTPNGVIVTHANLVNLIGHAPGNLRIMPGDTVGQVLNIAFDMAAWEILGTLSNGGTLIIRGADIAATAQQVDVLIATPSVLGLLDERHTRAHTVVVAGERCPQALADVWAERREFINSCGPTEITIINTFVSHTPGTPISIGTPVPGTNAYVLDADLQPVGTGEVGEMWVGGHGVTAGYLGAPDLTASRYLPDPFSPQGGRMFRTRDLVRWTPQGRLEHLSRSDDQVKVRGFRVELDSVARALEAAPGCEQAVVIQLDRRTLGAIITPESADTELALTAARERLPYYCIPEIVQRVRALPLTARGKVDRRAIEHQLRSESTRGGTA